MKTFNWERWEEIGAEVRKQREEGRTKGGAICCGTTGVKHRWFCFPILNTQEYENPPWMFDETNL